MKLDLRPARITRFEQDGDVVTRRVYLIDEDGTESLYHESTHSAESLEQTAKEMIKEMEQ
jgi:hypothetical protein